MKDKTTKTIRYLLTILLLWQVWTHSHWSVALSLTLNALAIETVGEVIKIMFKKK